MDFGEIFKGIRARNNLSQEQAAQRLHVSRQAVSNWENDRNLPDIEMLILIAREFGLSLDELILGETDMNNITEKLVRDTGETHRAKLNLIGICIGAAMLVIGAALLAIKALSVEYIDAQDVLHENFFLLPIGFAFIFGGVIAFAVTGLSSVIQALRDKNKRASLAIAGVCLGVVLAFAGGLLILIATNSGADTDIPGFIVAGLGLLMIPASIVAALIGKKKNAD